MLHGYSESDLLDLIEGELDGRSAPELRARLAGDPQASAAIEAMRSDRAALRSLEEPAVPTDFLARLEPILARPMLIDPVLIEPQQPRATKPGEFRRQQKRLTRRIRWGRLAAAAIVLLTVIAGVWAALNGIDISNRGKNRGLIAQNDRQLEPPVELVPPLSGTIHHHRPAEGSVEQLASANANGGHRQPAPTQSVLSAAAAVKVPASFVLVVRSADLKHTEDCLQRAAQTFGQSSALVRNFSFDEAQRLAQGVRMTPPGNAEDQPTVVADGRTRWKTPAELKALADRVRQYMNQSKSTSAAIATAPAVDDSLASAQLSGDPSFAPTLEQQLDFSSRGATYTIAIPANRISEFVERVSIVEGQATALRLLPGRDALPSAPSKSSNDAWQPVALWLTEGPQVRQAVEQLQRSRADSVVLLPVMIQADMDQRRR